MARPWRWRAAQGFAGNELIIALAVAKGESGWNPRAVNHGDADPAEGWGPSIGLWQVRSRLAERGTGKTRDPDRLMDPAFNARSAMAIRREQGWSGWTVYRTGAYRAHLAAARAAVGG